MASLIVNPRDSDFISSVLRESGLGHERQLGGYSESEKGSEYSQDYRPTGTQNSSHDVLYKHSRIYNTSDRKTHEFKTYLLDEK